MSRKKEKSVYGSGSFIRLPHELRNAPAYLALTKTEQLVLVDWVGHWNYAVAMDQLVQERYIHYSYGLCSVDVSDNAFYTAVHTLLMFGFMARVNPKQMTSGQSHLYRGRDKWRGMTLDLVPNARKPRVLRVLRRLQGFRINEQQQQLLLDVDAAPSNVFPIGTTTEKISGGGTEKISGGGTELSSVLSGQSTEIISGVAEALNIK